MKKSKKVLREYVVESHRRCRVKSVLDITDEFISDTIKVKNKTSALLKFKKKYPKAVVCSCFWRKEENEKIGRKKNEEN